MPEIIAAIAAVVTLTYALFGGADFGGGVWDLFARGPRKAARRAAIAKAMGPVWEANHVWLIFLIVILFTAFPAVYSTLSIALFLPFHLVLLGVVLRGAAFVFRTYSARAGAHTTAAEQAWGVVFGMASTITPLLLGMCLAAVSTGHIRVTGGVVTTTGAAWLSPLAIVVGILALALCAYLAAVFLANETKDPALQEDFRGEALISGTITVALSALLIPLLRTEAPQLWQGLFSPRSLPVVLVGTIAALAAGWCLRTRRYRLARTAAVVQVSALLTGWMLAEYPYLIYPDLTIQSAAAPPATLQFFIITLPLGALLLVPSLLLLFKVFKGDVLDLTGDR